MLAAIGALAGSGIFAALYWAASMTTWKSAVQSDSAVPTSFRGYEEWHATPSLMESLGELKAVENFALRPPKDCNLSVLPEPNWLPREGHFVGLQWQDPAAPDAELRCMIVTFSEYEPLNGGLEDALQRFLGWLKRDARLLTLPEASSSEIGIVNGQFCIRAKFSGRSRRRGSVRADEVMGLAYIMLDRNRQVCLFAICDPAGQSALDVMSASMLSWHRR